MIRWEDDRAAALPLDRFDLLAVDDRLYLTAELTLLARIDPATGRLRPWEP